MDAEQTVEGLLDYAHALLGSRLVHRDVVAEITEVEAYAGPLDPASHAFSRTPRSEIMWGPPNRLYVYFSYGVHWCANVVWGPEGTPGAVLLRAGRIVEGLDIAQERRGVAVAPYRLAQGPANLTAALGITGADNGTDLSVGNLRLELRTASAPRISSGPRVGVSKAPDEPWRFWIDGDPTVSVYRRSPRAPTGH